MTDTTRTDPTVRELPLAPDGEVDIFVASRGLRIRGTDAGRVLVRAVDGRSLDGQIAIDAGPSHVRVRDDPAGELRIGPLRMRAGRNVDLEVELPRRARVSLRALSGDVEASGIAGPSRWATASGDLRLRLEGGPSFVESMSGDIALECSAAIALTARSVSGTLRLAAPTIEALSASTTSGSITIDGGLASGAEHVLSSVSGDVRLATPSSVHLDVQTLTGDVRTSLPHRAEGGRGHRTLVVGDGSVRVDVRTMSGDVRLEGKSPQPPVRTEGAAPAAAAAEPPVVVAEATAAPNLVRGPVQPAADRDPGAAAATLGAVGETDRREAARLDVLRALERGDLDVDGAVSRLAALEDAGPRSFRGWC